jgi:hypothetical protein
MCDPLVEIPCVIHTGTEHGLVPDPTHAPTHSFTREQVVALLSTLAADDWEDGPRCLLDVLATVEEPS